ncbi:MAG: hypothetical protein AB3N14_07295 [Flavobacteriaceae bacterium]
MTDYYVTINGETRGEHEVHKKECIWLPERKNRVPLGRFMKSRHAVQKAKKYFKRAKGCYYCSREEVKVLKLRPEDKR